MYDERIVSMTSRHIAKCLDSLGSSVAPFQQKEIKKHFRHLQDDILDVLEGAAEYGNGDGVSHSVRKVEELLQKWDD